MTISKNTKLLIQSAESGNTAEVQRLIPISNPKANNSVELRLASSKGHTECVELLIPVSDPKSDKSGALLLVTLNEHHDCVDLLFDVSNPHEALQSLHKQCPDDPELAQYLVDKITAVQQRATLSREVERFVKTQPFAVRKI